MIVEIGTVPESWILPCARFSLSTDKGRKAVAKLFGCRRHPDYLAVPAA